MFSKGIMNEKALDFWQDHSLKYLEMALRTDRRERLASPDGHGKRRRHSVCHLVGFFYGFYRASRFADGARNAKAGL